MSLDAYATPAKPSPVPPLRLVGNKKDSRIHGSLLVIDVGNAPDCSQVRGSRHALPPRLVGKPCQDPLAPLLAFRPSGTGNDVAYRERLANAIRRLQSSQLFSSTPQLRIERGLDRIMAEQHCV